MKQKSKRKQYKAKFVAATPRWLQKRMLDNLIAASKNKVSPNRAKRAKKLLI
jgi:hypothetical protein